MKASRGSAFQFKCDGFCQTWFIERKIRSIGKTGLGIYMLLLLVRRRFGVELNHTSLYVISYPSIEGNGTGLLIILRSKPSVALSAMLLYPRWYRTSSSKCQTGFIERKIRSIGKAGLGIYMLLLLVRRFGVELNHTSLYVISYPSIEGNGTGLLIILRSKPSVALSAMVSDKFIQVLARSSLDVKVDFVALSAMVSDKFIQVLARSSLDVKVDFVQNSQGEGRGGDGVGRDGTGRA
ncbi:hypothetical protein U1Q18_023665 [Sarracenia purpurea var. burkii]